VVIVGGFMGIFFSFMAIFWAKKSGNLQKKIL
jgi:hypothetical protein